MKLDRHLSQFRSFRWNLTASAARPNPQGFYHYGQINITRTLKFVNTVSKDNGKLRYAINGVSHVESETPLKLVEYFGIGDKVFKYDTILDEPPANLGSQRCQIRIPHLHRDHLREPREERSRRRSEQCESLPSQPVSSGGFGSES
ncbi:L-ascorbate oxidase [Vigna unguiculata]|uniref:L-ascorbate oxidase n=1 Tax=Vigna unguiculata TaxID=3917 RepID=A0A4D6NRK1_VIGUN|nr:L-ascorbate oxidase [Vigna unguiculata]